MALKTAENKPRAFLLVFIFLQIILYALILLDIPIARQVIGFVYFTFVPGFVFVKLMKLDRLGFVATILFSLGFSIAFLMLSGLLINEFGGFFTSQPLSLGPLLFILNPIILIGGVLVYLRSDNSKIIRLESLNLPISSLFFLALPVLSVIGAMLVNIYENNFVLLFMLVSIILLFVMAVFSKKFLPSRLYPFAVLMIAVALLYHVSLISNYIVTFGSDISNEYFVFKLTQNSGYWSSTIPFGTFFGRYHAMLSITILPLTYTTLLNIDPTWIFKILTPLIFSFVPVGLYYVWKDHVGKKYAFISAFLFMAQMTFFTEMLGLNRQMIAELFLVLLLLVILNKELGSLNKFVCFGIFGSALIVSHYALAEIFLFFIFVALIFFIAFKHSSKNLTIGMVVLFFVIMFGWYVYTSSGSVFDSFLEFGNYVYGQLGDFFNLGSRGQTVLRGLGLEASPSIWNTFSRVIAYITEALIVFGFVDLFRKRIKNRHFGDEYFTFLFTAIAVLAAIIIVPGLASTLNITRFYHILLFFLAPLCIMGAAAIVQFMFKRRREILVYSLLIVVLGSYFLFQTGFVYEVTQSESWSLPLSKHRMDDYRLFRNIGFIPAEDVFGAQWVDKFVNANRSQMYADWDSLDKALIVYGGILPNQGEVLYNTTSIEPNGIVFLSRLNVVGGIIDSGTYLWNSSETKSIFDEMSIIYSNGGCDIYGK
jgi:uncharacterized membrane protein